jgi:hypothetical protein
MKILRKTRWLRQGEHHEDEKRHEIPGHCLFLPLCALDAYYLREDSLPIEFFAGAYPSPLDKTYHPKNGSSDWQTFSK